MSNANTAEKVKFFGDSDRNTKGGISSTYPGWYHEVQIENLKESIGSKERALASGTIPAISVPGMRAELEKEKTMYSNIMDSKPGVDEKGLDELSKAYKALGKKIKDSMFTYEEMERGTASSHEEAKRMLTPCIEIKETYIRGLLEACGIPLLKSRGDKINRNEASRAWKIAGKYLGEPTNTEVLRKRK